MYDKNGNITRAGAEEVIRGGGTVSIRGKVFATIESLPDEATFASGDPVSEADAKARLQKQIIDAQAQLARLNAPAAVTAAEGTDPNGARPAGRSGKS